MCAFCAYCCLKYLGKVGEMASMNGGKGNSSQYPAGEEETRDVPVSWNDTNDMLNMLILASCGLHQRRDLR